MRWCNSGVAVLVQKNTDDYRCIIGVVFKGYSVLMDENYQAFLLRLHRRKESAQWRASLENAHTGEILQFGSHTDLLLHLFQLLSDDSGRSLDSQQSPFNHTDSN